MKKREEWFIIVDANTGEPYWSTDSDSGPFPLETDAEAVASEVPAFQGVYDWQVIKVVRVKP